jgi:hypothetical protein
MSIVIVLAVLLGSLAVVSVRTPAVALVAVYCMFGMEQWAQANSAFFLANSTLINLAVAGVVAAGLASRYFEGVSTRVRMTQYYPAAGILVGLLFFYAFLTTFWTDTALNAPLRWLAAIPYWAVGVVAGPLLFRDSKDLAQAFAWQVLIGGIVAGLLYFGAEWQGRVIVLNQETIGITQSGQGNPLATAEMAGITVICATFAAVSFRGSALLRLIATAICLLVIVRSGSRGQLIGLAVALAAAFPIRYSIIRARVFAATAFVSLTGVLLVAYGLAEYWGSSGRFSDAGALDDYGIRMQLVASVLTAWLADTSAVLFGLGNTSSFDPALAGYYPHVVPVEILAEEGLIGALLYLAALLAVVAGLFRAVAARRDDTASAALATAVAIIVYAFLLSLKQGSLLTSTTFFMSTIILAKVCSAIQSQFLRKRAAERQRKLAAAPVAYGPQHTIIVERAAIGDAKTRQPAR